MVVFVVETTLENANSKANTIENFLCPLPTVVRVRL